MTSPWKPEQYDRFKQERSQPFFDLLALVRPQPGLKVVDLGCGTGELTQKVHQTLGASETLGLDSSETMLARSAAFQGAGLRFEQGDIGSFSRPGSLDLVFSNAALHWVADHDALLARLTASLASRGQLAVQVPANFDTPSHTAAAEVARESPFAEAIGAGRKVPVLAPERYAELLDDLGYPEQSVRLQVYAHHLESREGVVEWVKGTLLTDYETRLGPDLFPKFVERYRDRLFEQIPDKRPFLFTFKRLLIWARRL